MDYISWIQKSQPLEIALTVLAILLSILTLIGIVHYAMLVFSRIFWTFFQITILILILFSISIYLLNDEKPKIIIRNWNDKIGDVTEDISNWYDNMQFYGWAAEKIGIGRKWGYASNFGIGILQASFYETCDGIKQLFYNMTSISQ